MRRQALFLWILGFLILRQCRSVCDAATCLFCGKSENTCLLCIPYFTLNLLNECIPEPRCRYFEARQTDQSCIPKCLDTQTEFYNALTQEYNCLPIIQCPQNPIISQTQNLVQFLPGGMIYNSSLIQIIIQRYKYVMIIVEKFSGVPIVTPILFSQVNYDEIIGFKHENYQNVATITIVWSASQKVFIMITSIPGGIQFRQIDQSSYTGFSISDCKIEWLNNSISQIVFLINNVDAFIIVGYDIYADMQVPVAHFIAPQYSITNLNNLQFIDTTTIHGRAQNGSNPISFIVNISSTFVLTFTPLCTFDSQTYQTRVIANQMLILYYSSMVIVQSTFTSCSPFPLPMPSLSQVIVDEGRSFVFAILQNQIVQLSGPLAISPFDNTSSQISECVPFEVDPTTYYTICINSNKNKLFIVKVTLQGIVAQEIYFSGDTIELFYGDAANKQVYVYTSTTFFFADILTLTSPLPGCVFVLQQQTVENEEWMGKIAQIGNSLKQGNPRFIQRKLLVQFQDMSSQKMAQLNQLQGISQLVIVKLGNLPQVQFDTWMGEIAFPSVRFTLFFGVITQSISIISPVNQSQEIILDFVGFSTPTDSSSVTIEGMDVVVLKEVGFMDFENKNSVLFQIRRCKRVYIYKLNIIRVNLSNESSGLMSIGYADEVYIEELQILGCTSSLKEIISFFRVKKLEINKILFKWNVYAGPVFDLVAFINNLEFGTMPSESELSQHGTLLKIAGCPQIIIKDSTITLNLNYKAIAIDKLYQGLQGESASIAKSNVFFNNIIMQENGSFLKPIIHSISSNIYVNQFQSSLNRGIATNGTIVIESSIAYIQDSSFKLNQAMSGGALYFNMTTHAQIYSCEFLSNTAVADGGAILFYQSFGIFQKTTIQLNHAIIGGGVRIVGGNINSVHWDPDCSISQNTALLYGQNVVSRLSRRELYINDILMTPLTEDQVNQINKEPYQIQQSQFYQQGVHIPNIRSGQKIQFLIKLYDIDNKPFIFDFDDVGKYPIQIQRELQHMISGLKGVAIVIIGQLLISNYSAEKQGYISDELVIYGEPKKDLKIFFFESYSEFPSHRQTAHLRNLQKNLLDHGIFHQKDEEEDTENTPDHLITKNKTNTPRKLATLMALALIAALPYTTQTALVFSFRDCFIGEIYSMVNSANNLIECLQCPINSYTLSHTQIYCIKCPDSAFSCESHNIVLNDGFWRPSQESDQIYKCDPQKGNCLEYSSRGNYFPCKTGSIGVMCEGCDLKGEYSEKKYSMGNYNKECVECASLNWLILNLVLIFVFTTLYLLTGIRIAIQNSTMHSITHYIRMLSISPISNSSYENETNSYLKILTHYLQIMALISSTSHQFPDIINFLPKFTGNPISSFVLQGNCLYEHLGFDDHMKARVIQFSLLPIFYFLIIITIYSILSLIRIIKVFRIRVIFMILIYLLIFFQPDCVHSLISAVGCRELGPGSYLIADANYECYSTHQYFIFLYYFTIPSLIFWLVVPFFLLYLLLKRKEKLHLVSTKNTYGFLYLEFKTKYYLFEFVRSAFKIIIIAIFTFSNSSSSPSLKYDCIALVISAYIIIAHKIKPFITQELALIDMGAHISLLLAVFFQILLSQLTNESLIHLVDIFISILNIGSITLGILILSWSQIRQHNLFFIETFTKLRTLNCKCFPFLQIFKMDSSEKRIKMLLRWKLISRNLSFIINSESIYEPRSSKQDFKQNTEMEPLSKVKTKSIVCEKEEQIIQSEQQFDQTEQTCNPIQTLNLMSCRIDEDPIQFPKDKVQIIPTFNHKNNNPSLNLRSHGLLQMQLYSLSPIQDQGNQEEVGFSNREEMTPSAQLVSNNLLSSQNLQSPEGKY